MSQDICYNVSDVVCASILESQQEYKIFYFIMSFIFWGLIIYFSDKLIKENNNVIQNYFYKTSKFFGLGYFFTTPFTLLLINNPVNIELLFNYNMFYMLLSISAIGLLGIALYTDYTLKKYTGSSIFDEIKEKFKR